MSQGVLDESIVISLAATAHLDDAPGESLPGRGRAGLVGNGAAGCFYGLPGGLERRPQELGSLVIKSGICKQWNYRHGQPPKYSSMVKRNDLGLRGIALPAHVCAQLGSLDSGVGFNSEQPRPGAAPITIGAIEDFGRFQACLFHVLRIGFGEVLSINTLWRVSVT